MDEFIVTTARGTYRSDKNMIALFDLFDLAMKHIWSIELVHHRTLCIHRIKSTSKVQFRTMLIYVWNVLVLELKLRILVELVQLGNSIPFRFRPEPWFQMGRNPTSTTAIIGKHWLKFRASRGPFRNPTALSLSSPVRRRAAASWSGWTSQSSPRTGPPGRSSPC